MAALFAPRDELTVTSTTASYPLLHSLHVEVDKGSQQAKLMLDAAFIRPLLSLPSLHTLQLSNFHGFDVDWTAFRLLFTLPLAHLNLSGLTLNIPVTAQRFLAGADNSDDARRPIAVTWQVLKLPDIRTPVASRAEIMDALLQHYVDDGVGDTRRGELSHIGVRNVVTRDEVAILARLSTLRALELRPAQPTIDLEPLYTTSATTSSSCSIPLSSSTSSSNAVLPLPPLPLLRHLSITNYACDRDYPLTEREMLNIVQEHINVINCYSATLVCL